jgi:small-conductance mechanosensitive channel
MRRRWIGWTLVLDGLLQDTTTPLEAACGADPSFICREVLDRTDSERWAELADLVFAKPLTIALVIVVAAAVSWVAHRAVSRFVGAMTGDKQATRRLKRRLRRTRVGTVLPTSVLDTGAVSLRAAARAETLGLVLRSITSFIIWTIAFITILGELGINLGPLIAGAGLAGVALGFGAQSLVKDFLAGIFMLVEDQYGVGDVVDVGEANGTVEAVSLRTTRLRDVNGTVWHVPNGQILRVGNKSQQWARALLDVSVAYGSDLDQTQAIIKRVADELWREPRWVGQVLEEPEVWGIEDLAPDGVTIRLVAKTLPARQWDVMRELRSRIKVALDEAGVEIPYPQRTVWVRREEGSSMDVGGGDGFGDDGAGPARPAARRAPARKAAKKGAKAPAKAPAKRAPAKRAPAKRAAKAAAPEKRS